MIRKFNVQGHGIEMDDSLEYLSLSPKSKALGHIDVYGFLGKLNHLGRSNAAGILTDAVKKHEDYKASHVGMTDGHVNGLDNTSNLFRSAYKSIFGSDMPSEEPEEK